MTDAEHKAFQEESTGLNVEINRVEGNAVTLTEIQRLQANPEVIVTIEARVRNGVHSIDVNGISTDENGNMALDFFETAGYSDGNYIITDITGIRVLSYSDG